LVDFARPFVSSPDARYRGAGDRLSPGDAPASPETFDRRRPLPRRRDIEDHMVIRSARAIGVSLALSLALSGCALAVRRPSVAELKYNPGRYQDRRVSIDGVVTSSWGVPLVPLKFYKVDDGTGEVTVIAQDGRLPTRGAHVRVDGRVGDVATLGGQAIGLHIQQTDIHFKRR
jgi:hypothetical protein